ncbi:MAG: MaoC family dehydratase [Sciscionella sp.]
MNVTAGQQAPALERTITLPDMVAYAGATWDWHRLHYDPAYLAAKRLPAPVIDGQVFGALLAEQVQDWLGPRAFVGRLGMRFRSLVFAGETVRCVATVTGATTDGDATVVEVESRIDVVGEKPRPSVVTGHLTVAVRP